MLFVALHATAGNCPCLRCEIELAPRGAQRLAGPRRAENGELQGACSDVVNLPQLAHEGRHVDIWHRLVVVYLGNLADCGEHLLQVPTPPRWIVTGPKTTHRRPRQYTLNATASARGGFWLRLPNWFEHAN